MIRGTVFGLHPLLMEKVGEWMAHLCKAAVKQGIASMTDSDKAVADAVHRFLVTDHNLSAIEADQMTLETAIQRIPKATPLARVPKKPKTEAFQAWTTYHYVKKNMSEVGRIVAEKNGRQKPYNPGQVSRWIDQVDAYRTATGDTSLAPVDMPDKEIVVDPFKIEIGERGDHLTRRQRPGQSEEE